MQKGNAKFVTTCQKKLMHWFLQFVCRHRKNFLFRLADKVAVKFHRGFENENFDWDTNGERRVLEAMGVVNPRVIFDVGANVGDWSMLANSLYPAAQIHSFEAVSETYRECVRQTGAIPNIILENTGLSDHCGVVTFNYCKDQSGLSTGVDLDFNYGSVAMKSEKIEAKVVTGDSIVESRGIDKIDFLKIDVEGMEGKVLQGFRQSLQQKKIAVIQFEYGLVNVKAQFLLADFHLMFRSLGYIVGKIYPTYVDFSEYAYIREDFIGSNYLAVDQARGDLIDLLK